MYITNDNKRYTNIMEHKNLCMKGIMQSNTIIENMFPYSKKLRKFLIL